MLEITSFLNAGRWLAVATWPGVQPWHPKQEQDKVCRIKRSFSSLVTNLSSTVGTAATRKVVCAGLTKGSEQSWTAVWYRWKFLLLILSPHGIFRRPSLMTGCRNAQNMCMRCQ